MSAPTASAYDTHEAARNPRVVAEVLARDTQHWILDETGMVVLLRRRLLDNGITATEVEARALLDAVSAWDDRSAGRWCQDCQRHGGHHSDKHAVMRAYLDAALDAICGDRS